MLTTPESLAIATFCVTDTCGMRPHNHPMDDTHVRRPLESLGATPGLGYDCNDCDFRG